MSLRLKQSVQDHIRVLTDIKQYLEKNAPISNHEYEWSDEIDDAIRLYEYKLEDLYDMRVR